jgi:2,4-dienoyl-CoA reductase (NADPH2)
LIRYLSHEIRQHSNIQLQLNQTATADNIHALAPDHVIVATGALRQAPDFAGKEQRHVFDGDQMRGLLFGTDSEAAKKLNLFQRLMVSAGRVSQLMRNIDALRFLSKLWMPIADEVVIIGGGLVGLELAEYLIERGRKVTVLEPSGNLGAELSIVRRARVIHELREHGAVLITQAKIDRIGEKGVHYRIDDEEKTALGAQVIIAMGATANNALAEQISTAGYAVSQVGDCREVGYIEGAIRDARTVAQRI